MGKQDLLGPFKLGDRTTKISQTICFCFLSIPCNNYRLFERIEAIGV